MKKFFIAFCLVSTTLGFAQDMAVNIAYKGMSDSITKNELKEFYTEYEELRNLPITEEIKEAIVSTIIDKKLIQLEAQRLGINYTERELISMGKAQLQFRGSDQEFKAAVAEASQLSWEEYAKRSIEQIVEQRFLQQRPEFNIYNVSVTDQEVLRHYNQDKESFKNPIAVDVSHIFLHKIVDPNTLQLNREANEAKVKLIKEVTTMIKENKISFEEAVLQYSEDQLTRGDEGKLGLLTAKDEDLKSVFGADFFADIYILSIDQSVFWVESLVGFHIIRVNNRLEGEQLALNDLFISGDITLFEIIKNYLLEQKRNTVFSQAYNKLIANLRKEAIITRLSL